MQTNFLEQHNFILSNQKPSRPSNILNKGEPSLCRPRNDWVLFFLGRSAMGKQQRYHDTCVLCGRDLGGYGSKRYWPAHRVKDVVPGFQGAKRWNYELGVPHEKGGFVCRSRGTCNEARRSCIKTSEVPHDQTA